MLWAGVAAPVVAWGLSVAAAVAWPGYDPVVQSISVLARGPAGWLLTVAFVASGLLGLGWAVAMGRLVGDSARDRRLVAAVLGTQAVLVGLFAVFPTDLERGRTLTGVLHLVVFGLYAVETPWALATVAGVMGRDPRWAGWAIPTMWAARVVTVGLLITPFTLYGPLLPWLGLLERAFVAVPTGWQLAASVAALRRARRA